MTRTGGCRCGAIRYTLSAEPLATRLWGYFPGRRLGWLEDLPAGVAYEWAFRRARFERSHPAAERGDVTRRMAAVGAVGACGCGALAPTAALRGARGAWGRARSLGTAHGGWLSRRLRDGVGCTMPLARLLMRSPRARASRSEESA